MDGSIPNICSLLYGTAISRQVAIFGVILPFYIVQKWVKIVTKRNGQAEGGCLFFTPSLIHIRYGWVIVSGAMLSHL